MGYSLHDLDTKMLNYIDLHSRGFYIECGANNGIWQSNTKLLNEYGWTGLLVEPNPNIFPELQKNRPFDICENYALVSNIYNESMIEGFFDSVDYNNSLTAQVSTANRYLELVDVARNPILVPAITLSRLLDRYNISKIDFFSLDVEGYEINVLDGLDFNKYRPNYILIETANKSDRQAEILDYMISKNYSFVVKLSGNDDLFIDNKYYNAEYHNKRII